jgi:diguanylate cyclase (GGDEF)-like protein
VTLASSPHPAAHSRSADAPNRVLVGMLLGLVACATSFVPVAATLGGAAVVIPLLAAVTLFVAILLVAWRGRSGRVPQMMVVAYLASLIVGVAAVHRVDNGPEFVCVAIVFAGLTLRVCNVLVTLFVAWTSLALFYVLTRDEPSHYVSESSLVLYSGLVCALVAAVTAFTSSQSRRLLAAEAASRSRSEFMADRLRSLNATLTQQVDDRTAELRQAIDAQHLLLKQLKAQTVRDPLTKLFNRGYLDAELERLIAASRRSGDPVTVALIDVDDFKGINDSFGHQKGDEVIVQVANVLAVSVREGDVAARYGGDELALILPETSLNDAVNVCERVRRAVEAAPWHGIAAGARVTISIGLAQASGADEPACLMAAADRSLYRAKWSGRNRTVAER